MKEVYIRIGTILKTWRLAAGKTQRAAAKVIGKEHPMVWWMEQGNTVSVEDIILLQKYYNVKEKDKIVKDKALLPKGDLVN